MSLLVVIDEGGRIVRRQARAVLAGTALLLVPAAVVNVLAARTLADRFETADGVLGPFRVLFGNRVTADAHRVSQIVSLLLGSLTVAVIGGFVGEVVLCDRLGRPVTLGNQFRVLRARLGRLIGTWAIGHSWLVVVVVAAAAHPALGALAGLAAGLPLLWFVYAVPVVVGEGAGVRRALGRSRTLVAQQFDTTFALVLASAFVGLWLRGWLAALPALLEQTGLVTFGSLRWLAEGVAAQFGLILGIPIVAAATMLSFIDARVRLEGVDLLLEVADL